MKKEGRTDWKGGSDHKPATLNSLSPLGVQGYLAHKKPHPPRTLQKDYAQGLMVALRRGAVSDERGAPVRCKEQTILRCSPCARNLLHECFKRRLAIFIARNLKEKYLFPDKTLNPPLSERPSEPSTLNSL